VKHLSLISILMLALCLMACSNRYRRDFGGGEAVLPSGQPATALVLQDVASVELSLWDGAIPFDMRDYTAWAQGHIAGARRLTLEDLELERGLPQDKASPILFMGDGPLDQRPERAAEIALEKGHRNVQIFPGGWQAWTAGRTSH